MLENHYQGVKTLRAMQGLGEWVWRGIRRDPHGMPEVAGESLEDTWVVRVSRAEVKGRE